MRQNYSENLNKKLINKNVLILATIDDGTVIEVGTYVYEKDVNW